MEDETASSIRKPADDTPAARALAEAEARRASSPLAAEDRKEVGGRGGQDPIRYGDWEVKGLASDF